MKPLKKISTVLSISLFVFYLSCSKKSNEQHFFSDKKSDKYFKTVYNNDTILYINIIKSKEKEEVDTSTYIKKINGYYENVNDPFTNFKQRLRLSTKYDTLYNYNVINALFYCKISKLDNDKFKTTFANYDSLTHKYRHSIYYDKNYNIYKIEDVNNDSIFIYKRR